MDPGRLPPGRPPCRTGPLQDRPPSACGHLDLHPRCLGPRVGAASTGSWRWSHLWPKQRSAVRARTPAPSLSRPVSKVDGSSASPSALPSPQLLLSRPQAPDEGVPPVGAADPAWQAVLLSHC